MEWEAPFSPKKNKLISYYIPRECSLDFVSLLSALMVLFISFLAMLFSAYFTSFLKNPSLSHFFRNREQWINNSIWERRMNVIHFPSP